MGWILYSISFFPSSPWKHRECDGVNRYQCWKEWWIQNLCWKKGGFYILILIGTIAMILAALIILSESSLKSWRNNFNVRLGQLFDLLKAFFTVQLFHLKTTASAVCNLEGAQYWRGGGMVGILFAVRKFKVFTWPNIPWTKRSQTDWTK